ncbi:MAG TPA: hypothetical protein VJ697_04550, partial [Nitrososphaeraceae archaeon]|nr:hypothetical protein [Nitrososphaeraceae archaeon]
FINNNMDSLILFSLSLLFLYFVAIYDIIQTADGQMNLMDSFSAQGIIYTQPVQSPLLNNQNTTNNHTGQVPSQLNNNTNSSIQQDTSESAPYLQGQWAMQVRKGELKSFTVIFTLIQNEKNVNAFAITNLKNTKYIQLNNRGTAIISGTVDLASLGLKNETISNVEAIITIVGLNQLRITLDKTIAGKYFTQPLVGITGLLADGSGNILIKPRTSAPTQPSPPPSPAPIPQSNTFYNSKIF